MTQLPFRSTAPNIARLAILRDHLLAIANADRSRRFDLRGWFLSGTNKTLGLRCGTAACAVGEACFIPKFRAQGLRLSGDPRGRPPATHERQLSPEFVSSDGQVYDGWTAVEKFFGLDVEDALTLFSSGRYPDRAVRSPRAVARRIDQLIRPVTPQLQGS